MTALKAAAEAEVAAVDMEVETVNATDAEMLVTFLGIAQITVEEMTTNPIIVNRWKFYSGPPVSRCHVIPQIGGLFHPSLLCRISHHELVY